MLRWVCRVVQQGMRLASYFLPWREPELIRGEGALSKLPGILRRRQVESVLLVTDEGLMKIGLVQPLMEELKQAGIACVLYDRVVPNPTIDNIEEAAALYREQGCGAIIAFGGGSPMDCAKGCGARIARPDKTIPQMKGMLKVGRALPLLVAIPTTAGTGSETTLAAVVTDSVTHHKYSLNDPNLIPQLAVLEPSLTLGLPPKVTSTTGMDALSHAVEAYIGHSNTRKTRQNALEAVRLIFANVETVYRDGGNAEARANMQHAAFLAGVAFTRAYVGYVHALSHALSGRYQLPHGLAIAVTMPYVLRAYGSKAWRRLSELSLAAGVGEEGASHEENADRLIAAIERLNRDMDIPATLPQIDEADIPQMAQYAAEEGNLFYPCPKVLLKPELEALYRLIKGEDTRA